VRFWRQEAADLVLFASVGGLRSPELGLVPIFQTVSEGAFSEVGLGSGQTLRRLFATSSPVVASADSCAALGATPGG
jgi:hypothetical protein